MYALINYKIQILSLGVASSRLLWSVRQMIFGTGWYESLDSGSGDAMAYQEWLW